MAKKLRKSSSVLSLLSLILWPELVGVLITVIILASSYAWYNRLSVPVFYTHSYLYGIMWLFVYLVMAAALYVASTKKRNADMRIAYALFGVAVILPLINAVLFWQFHLIVLATEIMILELIAVMGLTVNLWDLSNRSSGLLILAILLIMFWIAIEVLIIELNGL